MNIVLISSQYGDVGGAEAVAKNLAESLVDHGHDVTIITTNKSGYSEQINNGVKIINVLPFNVYWIGDNKSKKLFFKVIWQIIDIWNIHSFFIIKNIITKISPDVVHVHKMRGFSPSIWLAIKLAGVKCLVQTCHDYEAISPEGTLIGNVAKLIEKKSFLIKIYQYLRKNTSNCVDAVTAPSDFTLKKICEHDFFKKSIRQVIPNTHNYSKDQLCEIKNNKLLIKKKDSIDFLYIGRLEPNKGVELLCKSFSRATCRYNNIYLNIIGSGSQSNYLKSKFVSENNIRFLGPMYGEKKEYYLYNSDYIVVPSVWPEVFGIVLVEGFSFGLPAIASNIGGIPELIYDNGFLSEPGNEVDLLNKIEHCVVNMTNMKNIINNCFDSANIYSKEVITDQYISLYKKVLASNK